MKPEERFNILQSVASDDVGEVFQTVRLDGQGLVALKRFNASVLQNANARAAYEAVVRKIHAAGLARTPRPFAMNLAADNGWVGTEWVGAETLADFARRLDRFESEVAAGIGCGVLDALIELHDLGVVHGGLSPSNIWLTQGFLPGGVALAHPAQYLLRGEGPLLTAGKAAEGVSADSARYIAPERVRGEATGVSSDLYAVGVILYELLTGKPFYEGSADDILNAQLNTPAPQANAGGDVAQDLSDIIAIALSKDPSQRFQAAIAMRRALAHCRKGGDETSEQASAPLGQQRGQNIVPLVVADKAADGQAAKDAAAATAAAAAAQQAAKDAAAKDAAAQQAAKDAAAKEAAAKDAAAKDAAAKDAAAKQAAKDVAAKQAAEKQVQIAAPLVAAASEEVSQAWFAVSEDEEEFKRLHGEEEPPPLHEINRKYRRKSYVLIASIIVVILGAFLALHFLTPSATADNAAEVEETRVYDTLPT